MYGGFSKVGCLCMALRWAVCVWLQGGLFMYGDFSKVVLAS